MPEEWSDAPMAKEAQRGMCDPVGRARTTVLRNNRRGSQEAQLETGGGTSVEFVLSLREGQLGSESTGDCCSEREPSEAPKVH